jgi:hypothetical protein
MAIARRGVFHWMLGTPYPSGQQSGVAITATIKAASPNPTATLNIAAAIAHELGHTTGIQHNGSEAVGNVNCKPQYASIMSYAYTYQPNVGFCDGNGPGWMNNTSVLEFEALLHAPNRSYYADMYERVFGYWVDRGTWSVDFDRDGEFAPKDVGVRAYANSIPFGDCEGTRERSQPVLDGGQTSHSPALVRLGTKLLLFTATDAGLELRVGDDTYANCTTPGGGDGDMPCGTFGAPQLLPTGLVSGVDAVRLTSSFGEVVIFTYVSSTQRLRAGSVTLQGNTPSVSISPISVAYDVIGEPSMTVETPNRAFVVFKTTSNVLQETTFSTRDGWAEPTAALGTTGPLVVNDAPGVVMARMPGDTNDALYLHAQVDPVVPPTLLVRRPTGRWESTPFATRSTNVRPGLAYVPNGLNPEKGTLYTLYVLPNSNVLQMSTSGWVAKVDPTTGAVTQSVGFDATFDNGWAEGQGTELLFEPGRDTNLRAVIVPYPGKKWEGKAVLRPLADGIVDQNYGDFNDWEQIGLTHCASVANPSKLVSSPMDCW